MSCKETQIWEWKWEGSWGPSLATGAVAGQAGGRAAPGCCAQLLCACPALCWLTVLVPAQEAAVQTCPVLFLCSVPRGWDCFVVKALWLFLSLWIPTLLPPCFGFPHPFVLCCPPAPSASLRFMGLLGEIDQPGLMHLEELINDTAAHSPPLLWNNFSAQIKHPICHKLGKAKRAPLLY